MSLPMLESRIQLYSRLGSARTPKPGLVEVKTCPCSPWEAAAAVPEALQTSIPHPQGPVCSDTTSLAKCLFLLLCFTASGTPDRAHAQAGHPHPPLEQTSPKGGRSFTAFSPAMRSP